MRSVSRTQSNVHPALAHSPTPACNGGAGSRPRTLQNPQASWERLRSSKPISHDIPDQGSKSLPPPPSRPHYHDDSRLRRGGGPTTVPRYREQRHLLTNSAPGHGRLDSYTPGLSSASPTETLSRIPLVPNPFTRQTSGRQTPAPLLGPCFPSSFGLEPHVHRKHTCAA